MRHNANHLNSTDIESGATTNRGNNSDMELLPSVPQNSNSMDILSAPGNSSTFDDGCDTFGEDATEGVMETNSAVFIRQFPQLRRSYRERIESKLQQLEDALTEGGLAENHPDYDEKLDEAASLLRQYNEHLQDDIFHTVHLPALAQEHDLSIIHIRRNTGPNTRAHRWIMISRRVGKWSKTIPETTNKGLQPHQKKLISAGDEIRYQRPKTILENWVLWFIVALIIIGYGTCVVGANMEFSGGMKRFFFVIALSASLILGAMFSWLVWVLDGTIRDVTTAFVTFLALALVVLQVAQTHLIAQDQKAI